MRAGRRAASGLYADAHALQYAVSSLGGARTNPRGVLDSVGLRSAHYWTFEHVAASVRCMRAGERQVDCMRTHMRYNMQLVPWVALGQILEEC